MNCPHCGKEINAGAILGSVKSAKKAKSSRENAKLGGWPKGKPRKKKRVAMSANDPSSPAASEPKS